MANINISGTGDETTTAVDVSAINKRIDSKVDKNGDEMSEDLLLKAVENDLRLLGCNDLNNQVGFCLLLGSFSESNSVRRTRCETTTNWILTSENGVSFQVKGNGYLRVGSDVDPRIIAYKPIKLVMGPVEDNDAASKGYVDTKVGDKTKKNVSGLILHLTANMDKTGYTVSASSEHNPSYHAYNADYNYAVSLGDDEWTTFRVSNNFWFKVKCLQRVRVWRFVAAGRKKSKT